MKTLTITVGVLIGLVLLLPLTQVAAAPMLVNTHKPQHGGGSTTGGAANIDLVQCDAGGAAKWKDPAVSYKIDNVAGVTADVINAIDKGVQEWNNIGGPYTLTRDDSAPNPDVTIKVFFKITPGYILGASFVTCPDTSTGIIPHEIWLGVKGLKLNGVQTLAAHEAGHSVGLGHADKNADLMGPSLDSTERRNVTCPSNLDKGALSATGTYYSVTEWQLLTSC